MLGASQPDLAALQPAHHPAASHTPCPWHGTDCHLACAVGGGDRGSIRKQGGLCGPFDRLKNRQLETNGEPCLASIKESAACSELPKGSIETSSTPQARTRKAKAPYHAPGSRPTTTRCLARWRFAPAKIDSAAPNPYPCPGFVATTAPLATITHPILCAVSPPPPWFASLSREVSGETPVRRGRLKGAGSIR